MIELAGLLAKYKILGSKRNDTLDAVRSAVSDTCGFEVTRTQVTVDDRSGDVRIEASGPKRVALVAHKDEIARRISERFGAVYRLR